MSLTPTNTIKVDRIPFDPCNSIKRFDICPFDQKNSTYLQPPSKDVYNYLKSEELRNTIIILWHDLINNTITPHKSNNYQPQSVNQLVASLRSLTNLCGIVDCQRTGSPNIFEDLRTLDCPIIQVTTDILRKSEQRSEVLVEKYKALHHASDLELRSLGVVLHYYPNLRKVLKTRGTKRRTHEQRREAKRKREDN